MKLSLHSRDLQPGLSMFRGGGKMQLFDVTLFTEGFNHPAAAAAAASSSASSFLSFFPSLYCLFFILTH